MKTTFLLCLALVAGGVAVAAPATAQPACVRAEAHGAIPNDGVDDRAQLQNAINAAQAGPGCLEIGPGIFHATRKPIPGTANIGSLKITATLDVRGAGEGVTTLAMLGSAIIPGSPNPRDWNLLEITGGATGVSVSELSLDGSQRRDTGEQTHLLQLTGPTTDTLIEHVTFTHPIIGPNAGGDCIRLLGEATRLVRDTTIRDVLGQVCDRSFVSLQRGLDGLLIERGESVLVGDQAIDFEPTGGNCDTPILRDVVMRDLTLRKGDLTGATVTIAGDNCAVADNVTLADSVIEDGHVFILNADNVTLSGLHLRSVPGSPKVPLLIRERATNLRVLDTTIERLADAGTGPSVKISGQDDFRPTSVLLSGVRIRQETAGALVEATNLDQLRISNAELTYVGPPVTNAAVAVGAQPATPSRSPVIMDTIVRGALAGVITTNAHVGPPILIRVTGP